MGFNTWLGHYNSSSNTQRPYRDCHCNYSKIGNPNVNFTYVTLDEMRDAKRRNMNANTAEEKNCVFKSISKQNIHNALTEPNLPLSDLVHGPYHMMPPELLHISGSGLIKYMFASLKESIGTDKPGNDKINKLDSLHQQISTDILHQSDKNIPRGSVCNGILDGTKCQSSKQRGNLFCLLCLSYTTAGIECLSLSLQKLGIIPSDFCSFIKMYLAMKD